MSVKLNEHLENYTIKNVSSQARHKSNLQKAKDIYKKNKCLSLQVFIEKELVIAFRQKAAETGVSQSSIIREFVISFLEGD